LNKESCGDAVGNSEKDQKKSGNHRKNLSVCYDMQCRFALRLLKNRSTTRTPEARPLGSRLLRRGSNPLI
jgi:hypothetical protein